ncbi:uncharacterized protein LOC114935674 [Nylanderia fulva]|uniref:uncharacterized protein LOC114935674 n=1 Tax=Nylanderia fulva TaxID=613905 RepID=UPI0010FB0A6E|nr:uncharacterized protein LOC114935674 [Nylanderia fulva]
MAENERHEENEEIEIKIEPQQDEASQCYIQEEQNSLLDFESVNLISSNADVAQNLWTSRATTCLINQYKKYRSQVGQSTQIKSLRGMFEMISMEMHRFGYHFSAQKCENKWRVLERKYKNLVFRERLRKPGRMRHYGQWEHKRALDEIFDEKRKYVYLERNEEDPPSSSRKCPSVASKRTCDQGNLSVNQQHEDCLAKATTSEKNETSNFEQILTTLFDKFTEEMAKHFVVGEKNKERRHREKMAVRQKELELKKQLLKLKEQKIELQRSQIIAAAQNLMHV